MSKKLDRIFKKSKRIPINDNTKIVIMSDCHRGSGNNHDNFIKNEKIFESALRYYYINNFTYIELGDGDEMWEVSNYKDIIIEHQETFKLLKKFYDNNHLIMIYGNHDMCKKSKKILKENFYYYYDKINSQHKELFNNIIVYESLVLNYKDKDIFMIHGHQIDLLNGTLWRLSRFLVRYVWRNLEFIGINDPTLAAKNYSVSKGIEKRLEKWSIKNNKILISGHTHRPVFPKVGQSLYFNDGSCIHPNGITCLEIENGNITLVKWLFKLEQDKFISVGRVEIEKKEAIESFFINLESSNKES